MYDEELWEERYRAHTSVWSGRPNPQLVTEASELPAGRALDVGCGEGADALWLASGGWQVMAVDFATTALRRGAEHAEALGAETAARVDWVHTNLTAWEPPREHFDLVSAQFMHLPRQDRQALFARLADAVAPGGTLLIVGHHPSDLETTVRRPRDPGLLYTAEEVAADLDSSVWDALATDVRPRAATDAEGQQVTIHDAVLLAHKSR